MNYPPSRPDDQREDDEDVLVEIEGRTKESLEMGAVASFDTHVEERTAAASK
jgi:hypothetical protein